jgi:sugar lactone lactonase YvrE
VPVAIAATVGVVAAVAAAVVVTSGGGDNASTTTDTTIAAVATTAAGATTVASTTTPPGARGVTGATAIIAGLPRDNTGKGVPGDATAVSLGAPTTLAAASNGNIYLIDTSVPRVLRVNGGKVTVAFEGSRAIGGLAISPTGKVVLLTTDGLVEITADGQSTVLATTAALGNGIGPGSGSPLAFDGAGNLYIGNSNRNQVLRRSTDGTMSLVAGNGNNAGIGAPEGDGGPATAAVIGGMNAMVVDGKGNLLVSQRGGAIRRISATDGTISTIAGAGATPFASNTAKWVPDGTKAVDIDFAEVNSMVVDAKGRIYVGDSQSGAIIRILSDGTIEFVAGDQAGVVEPETTKRPANLTRVADANGLSFDNTGALLVAEAGLLLRIEGVNAG